MDGEDRMELGLAGKRALVTGAATGIGRSTVLALAGEGVTVAALDIDEGALAELAEAARAGSVLSIKADLSTAPGCAAAVEAALGQLGGLDILVNNVGAGAVR